jgi:hypothetical protein
MKEKTYGRSDRRRPDWRRAPSARTPAERMRLKNIGNDTRHLCDACAARSAVEEAERSRWVEKQMAADWADIQYRCRNWLRQAPVLDQLPDFAQEFRRDASWDLDTREFFEVIKDFDEAVDLCTKGILRRHDRVFYVDWGLKPYQEPESCRDVLSTSQGIDHGSRFHWTGALYRTANGWVVLHWHTRRYYWDG